MHCNAKKTYLLYEEYDNNYVRKGEETRKRPVEYAGFCT